MPQETWRGLPRCSKVTLWGEDGGLPMSLCAIMIQSPRVLLREVSTSGLRAKRPSEDTRWRSSSTACEKDRCGSALAATWEW